jgi:hypothetical protein
MVKALAQDSPGRVPDEHGETVEIWLQLLADDEGVAAMGANVEKASSERIAVSAIWGHFFGVDLKDTKCWSALGLWSKESRAESAVMQDPAEHERCVTVQDRFMNKELAIRIAGPYECNRVLGQQRSLGQYPGIPKELAVAELEVTTRAVQQMPGYGWLAKQVASTVGWRRLAYRLTYTYVFGSEAPAIMQPLRKAVMSRLRVPANAAKHVSAALVWSSAEDMLNADRIAVLLKTLSWQDTRGRAMAGAVQRLQQYVGCSDPVLQTKLFKCGCSGGCKGDKYCSYSSQWHLAGDGVPRPVAH